MNNQDINFNSREKSISLTKEKEVFIREGQAVGAGAATEWISNAWQIFKANPMQWILLTLIYIVIMAGLNFIPFLNLVSFLFGSVFVAGFIAAAEKKRTTGNFEIELLFYGFKDKLGTLVAVGALYLGIYALGVIAAVLVAGFGIVELFLASQYGDPNPALLMDSISSFIGAIFVFCIFSLVALAFIWFAPALIIINDMKFGEAVSMSLNAVKKNLLGGFLFFLLMGILIVTSMIPLLLGLIITIPMNFITYYTTYRSIFYTSKGNSSEEQKSSLII
ncbi:MULTISPECIES: BPSS1780 family membrane protein [Xenorhabdus]|uniref:BPSS1780 family membrane protein n=1 Tax=Xenorhabdus TaxID=626 RepID=UPI0006464AA8|nr:MULTISPECIES: BPSS1780 family membrane protein [Xenorhabdus]